MTCDVAIEATDMMLMNDDLDRAAVYTQMFRKELRRISVNVLWSIICNPMALMLNMRGLMAPVVRAIFQEVGYICVVLSSMFSLRARVDTRKPK